MESNNFIDNIHLDKLQSFPVKYAEYLINKLRQDVYIFMISRKSEEEFFDLSDYDDNVLESVLELLYKDLKAAKWNYTLGSYKNIYIYK
jgi:hypothetical protein